MALNPRPPAWFGRLKPRRRVVARFLGEGSSETVHPIQDQLGTNLLQQLSEEFQAPLPFVENYFYNNFGQAPDLPVHEWLAGLSDLQRLHVTYALSTNQRAEEVCNIVAQHRSTPIGRHLDIGCGYGGLLRAFSQLGATISVGIEINETLAQYSRLNTAGVNAKIHRASVEDFDFRELGKFDLITCTEVIEHVRNPPYLVKVISGLLETGGTLFLRVPNGRSVNFVRQDGHFLLFGICLLSRQEAKEFKLQTTNSLDDYEHMGEYFQRGYYTNLLLANE